jgi:hypothetical protein
MTEDPYQPLYCANHPNVETSLRCRQCDKPICPKCAVRTPTGYKCKECVKGQQQIFNTATGVDYALAFIVAGILSLIGSVIAQSLGFFTFFIAPFAGIIIAEAVRLVTGRRRSRALFNTALAGTIAGCLPTIAWPLIASLLIVTMGGDTSTMVAGGLSMSFSLLWNLVYAVMACTSMYYRLSGISLGHK